MTGKEGGLTVIIFLQMFIISALCGWMYQQKKNEEIMFQRLEQKIELIQQEHEAELSDVEKKIATHDKLINSVIKHQSMTGMFDKKGKKK